MCSSEVKVSTSTGGVEITPPPSSGVARINGRPVLQPTCNRVPTLDRRSSFKNKIPPISPPPPVVAGNGGRGTKAASMTPPLSPNLKSPRHALNSSSEKVVIPRNNTMVVTKTLERKKSKSFKEGMTTTTTTTATTTYCSLEQPGSIAAVRREQVALQQAQRKMRIAHYGRSKSAKFESKVVPLIIIDDSSTTCDHDHQQDHYKRCSFITPNSDPIYVAYHDEEWGVPVHDDSMLFELLVLSGAQVGSDWTSILKKREAFREAFSGFDAEIVAKLTDKQITAISSQYGIDISRVRGVVDNSNRILEVKREFGSFDKYIWGFVNNKAISTQYKFGHKIPVKTSKSESISKDMVRRGFRLVGPTVVHSFMQAAGLTNDHLITCHRHLPCTLLAARSPPPPPPCTNMI